MTIVEIESLTKAFADVRNELADVVGVLNLQIENAKRKHLADIKRLVARCADKHGALKAAIESAPGLFDKPRTAVFHGIKVGFRKSSGSVDWEDDEQVAKLVEKHFPEQLDLLVKTSRKPIAKALLQLSVAELKKIGCTAEETGDVVVIKPTDSEVDKIVNALLNDATEEAAEEAA
jgi:hypothetical protein